MKSLFSNPRTNAGQVYVKKTARGNVYFTIPAASYDEPFSAYADPSISGRLPPQYQEAMDLFSNPSTVSKKALKQFNDLKKSQFIGGVGGYGVVNYKPVKFMELAHLKGKAWVDELSHEQLLDLVPTKEYNIERVDTIRGWRYLRDEKGKKIPTGRKTTKIEPGNFRQSKHFGRRIGVAGGIEKPYIQNLVKRAHAIDTTGIGKIVGALPYENVPKKRPSKRPRKAANLGKAPAQKRQVIVPPYLAQELEVSAVYSGEELQRNYQQASPAELSAIIDQNPDEVIDELIDLSARKDQTREILSTGVGRQYALRLVKEAAIAAINK